MPKSRKAKIWGLIIFALGIAAVLIGALTDLYSIIVGVIITTAIWLVLGPIVTRIVKGPGRIKEFKETTKTEHWKDY